MTGVKVGARRSFRSISLPSTDLFVDTCKIIVDNGCPFVSSLTSYDKEISHESTLDTE